ncbi:glycerol kinase GlpK [Spirochaeta isovalerica]|uniref:Glycerol kinase n=1 Tax=Spirochaeta isovalerica TaxID=150 RepID=A0A841R7M8_9SPIO|nr:glycerol kinase GlpK [Spirochaeta isovalerica]MBB6478748.1 glycerol kinase [Spirochaeta isovalerica]
MKKYIISLDQGTTSSRVLLVNKSGNIEAVAQQEFTQIYPREKWVEHDPVEIWNCQIDVFKQALGRNNIDASDIEAIGITNQRETTVVWDINTGKPVYNAIVWQCRRTVDICESIREKGLADKIKAKTGLPLDAYFSATKIMWILENVEGAREKAEKGDLLFGTIDTWLLWNLTGGKIHKTDFTNASRTMIFNIHELKWDEELLQEFNIPVSMLPQVEDSSFLYGHTDKELFGVEIPITGIAGDQQSALFGQMCLNKGDVKNTYGTGCFMLMNTGEKPVASENGLLTTIAIARNGVIHYALEGSVFMAGAVIQWLRDDLRIISDAMETETMALSVKDSHGVYLVSAFQGIGTPYWDMDARAGILGLTRGAKKEHIVRAALESIAYRSKDVLDVMVSDSGIDITSLKVDGGASRNNFLLQFQSDITGVDVIRPQLVETTAMGAAFLAGLATGFWKDVDELASVWSEDRIFSSTMDTGTRETLYKGWKKAISRVINWDN